MTEAAIYDVAERFGVDLEQARRDHVISHVLAAISRRAQDRFIFYGGTALSRTWLPDARLSEDVDLMVIGRRHDGGDALVRAIDADIARPFLGASWSKDPRDARDAEDVMLTTGTGAVSSSSSSTRRGVRPGRPCGSRSCSATRTHRRHPGRAHLRRGRRHEDVRLARSPRRARPLRSLGDGHSWSRDARRPRALPPAWAVVADAVAVGLPTSTERERVAGVPWTPDGAGRDRG